MKDWVRIGGIFIASLFACAIVTVIAPFYPQVAHSRGISATVIGLVFSSAPFTSLIGSYILPIYLEKLGRKQILILGLLFVGLSGLVLSVITICSTMLAILISFFSRMLAGAGTCMIIVTSYSIIASDYPEKVSQLVAGIEIISGVGLIIGPTAGSLIFPIGFFYCCIIISGVVIAFIPLLYISLGESKPYVINIILQIVPMFSFGFTMPTTEFHLLEGGVSEKNIGYWFSIGTLGYMVSSIVVSMISESVHKPRVMLCGSVLMGFAFLFLGPSPLFFESSLVMTGIGLALIGMAGGLIYVPSLPHMIELARVEYNYNADDRLNDALSGITNMSMCIGEITGPIVSSLLYQGFGYRYAATVMSFTAFGLALVYLLYSDAWKGPQVKKKTLSEELIEM